ncbi:MAG: sugar phosphate isomerase/epimerase [Planctomycetia bacterium]|nr:sugar phosphate isomerase/epimerase [Planctomycetia bacterium]
MKNRHRHPAGRPPAAPSRLLSRRRLLASAAMVAAAAPGARAAESASALLPRLVVPRTDRRILLSCKLSMIARERDGEALTLVDRLRLATEAGFDGVDFDQAGQHQPAEVRQAVAESGVFVHNAINHAHWKQRLTSADPAERATAVANLEHCIRVSHAAGGSGVLIVLGKGEDGPAEEIERRSAAEIRRVLPLAASLGQPILIENVWNRMLYDHDAPPEQGPERFIAFIDQFQSPWVGLYYDIGNHWKYCQPAAWIRALGHRCVKLDIKGFSRAKSAFCDIASADDDVPWADVRRSLAEIGFAGWATAEVKGGDGDRLTIVRRQMEQALLA